MSATATEFVPRATPRNTSKWAFEQAHQDEGESCGGDPIKQVEDSMASLLYSPGKFEVTAAHLTEVLNATVTDLDTLRAVVDRVVEQCLAQANFRYSGARLLDHLAATVTVSVGNEEEEGGAPPLTLGEVLLDKCRAIYSTRDELIKTDIARFRSFALFLADLFLQFGHFEASSSEDAAAVAMTKRRVPELGESTMELLSALLERQAAALTDKEDVRAIAQALKMAGGALEEEERLSPRASSSEDSSEPLPSKTPRMDALMSGVASLAAKEATVEVPAHMLQMLGNLAELRRSGWGAAMQQQHHQQQQQQQQQQMWSPQQPQQQPHLHGSAFDHPSSSTEAPAELELTAEEEAFMKEHLGADVLGDDDDDDDDDDVSVSLKFQLSFLPSF